MNYNARNFNIVRLYGYFNHKDYILLIMEHMNNRDLKHFMKKFHSKNEGNLSEVLTGYFLLQILKAMGYLKVRNILHRDIKPENIMLNNNYVAKLGDFSLSRKIDLNSKFKTTRSGTLPYLSPECVKKKTTIKSIHCEKLDLFSLGVVTYYLLFNRHPYNYKVIFFFLITKYFLEPHVYY
jgi:serine/threonine protein kinase